MVTGVSAVIIGEWKLDSIFGFGKGNLKLRSTFNYIKGKNISDSVPLGHIPPFYGLTSIKYQGQKKVKKLLIYFIPCVCLQF